MSHENHFLKFRENIIGIDARVKTPYGVKPLIYADWIASGRMYKPIEEKLVNVFGPVVANTHSESSETGKIMTNSYHLSHKLIKEHVHAGPEDVIITAGFGMTAVVNKLQRMLGLKVSVKEQNLDFSCGIPGDRIEIKDDATRPVVFVTHLEHHSNHTSWLETIADVIVLEPNPDMTVNPASLAAALEEYKNRELKIGAFSACSNVTGIFPPFLDLARLMHKNGGFAFVDYAASAPYVDIDMHPEGDPCGYLDGIFFSPHKFLGGPGSSGVLIFNQELYRNSVPDHPGGGTVTWTNRWGNRSYITDIEAREDGGTPGFLQSFRTALSINLKNQMGTANMAAREEELLVKAMAGIRAIPGVHILADNQESRIGVISFYNLEIHHNLFVRLLNDHFGIQVRGGCSCAGTYGHYLLQVSQEQSQEITEMIDHGDLSLKPGWVRLSLHPTMTDAELDYILNGIESVASYHKKWIEDYNYDCHSNEFFHKTYPAMKEDDFRSWFEV
ncbi:MAG: aminotransferase class V-fold PLP-dependent enzyme [Spirochaetales bacterium]|nr:aminotransferase class V-fold PLP-dependent enzyme [Spirochaetales bacterium]